MVFRLRRPGLVDLTEESAFTLVLLDAPAAWRHRLVTEVELAASDHVQVTSSYQIEFPPDMVQPFLPRAGAERLRVLLPLTTREKRPLLRLDIIGPSGGPAALMRRADIAAIQAEYLSNLARSSPVHSSALSGLSENLLEAIAVFTPAVARWFAAQHRSPNNFLSRYLSDGLGFDVSADVVAAWRHVQAAAAGILTEALGEGPDAFSSSEQVLLAVPLMDPKPESVEEIDAVVQAYGRSVQQLSQAGDSVFLQAIAEYGRRWDVIVEVDLPLGRPSTITLREDRRIEWERRNWFTHRVPFGDARSFHFEANVSDHHVAINDFVVRDLTSGEIGVPVIEAIEDTPHLLALYSSAPERPYYADVRLKLRATPDIRWPSILVGTLAWLSILGAVCVPRGPELVGALGVLVVPTTFAVALVLVRQESALAGRLQRFTAAHLSVVVALLWIIALLRLLGVF